MASEADSGPVDKVEENRFIKRAEYLHGTREAHEFREDLRRLREQWALDFPAFPLGEQCQRPLTVRMPYEGFFYPPDLDSIDFSDSSSIEAAASWHDRVLALCYKYWPADRFQNWLGPVWHPSSRYVSACVLWEPETVPCAWAVRSAETRIRSPHLEPTTYDENPEVVGLRAANNYLIERMSEFLPAHTIWSIQVLSEKERFDAFREAFDRTKTVKQQVIIPTPNRDTRDGVIRDLAESGHSAYRIAQLMGLDKSTVGDILKGGR